VKTIKPKKCDTCLKDFTPFQSFQKVCKTYSCMIAYAKKKEQKKKDKVFKVRKDDFVLNDTRKQHVLTQKVFNKMRKLQEFKWFADKGVEPYCISCGKTIGGDQWCNGHFKTVGANGRLRYDEVNSHLQHNRSCNMAKSGDIYGDKNSKGYIQGLKDRFGDDKAQEIIDYCESNTAPRKWTGQELSEMRKRYNVEIRRREAQL